MIRRACILGALLALLPTISHAALRVMFDGIAGPNTVPPYVGWFLADAVAWSTDRSNPVKPFTFTIEMRQYGIGFATLAQVSFSGAVLKRVIVDNLHVISGSAGGAATVTSRLNCEEAQLREMTTAADGDDAPTIELKIACNKFSWENFDMDKGGAVISAGKGSWNIKANTP